MTTTGADTPCDRGAAFLEEWLVAEGGQAQFRHQRSGEIAMVAEIPIDQPLGLEAGENAPHGGLVQTRAPRDFRQPPAESPAGCKEFQQKNGALDGLRAGDAFAGGRSRRRRRSKRRRRGKRIPFVHGFPDLLGITHGSLYGTGGRSQAPSRLPCARVFIAADPGRMEQNSGSAIACWRFDRRQCRMVEPGRGLRHPWTTIVVHIVKPCPLRHACETAIAATLNRNTTPPEIASHAER